MIVLGIETSCDETACAIVDDARGIRANVVLSQLDEHRPYGGVVPEVAARAHLHYLDGLIRQALDEAHLDLGQVDAIAATGGPGLIGGVIVGVMTAKAMAAARGLPFVAVNHLEGHALTARLTDDVPFPYLLLLVSGGHCQLLEVEGVGQYRRLGTTIDDAVGEAFDKTAKLLGLGYPGGPLLEKAAARATNPGRFELPAPMKGRPDCDFSFSGLKTAVRRHVEQLGTPTDADVADLAAAFHHAVGQSLLDRCDRAIKAFKGRHPANEQGGGRHLVVAGGVAANKYLREQLAKLAAKRGLIFTAPPLNLCTDNAAMIAWAGLERFRLGRTDGLDFAPRPRWPLDPTAKPMKFAGVKA
ncbi:tRNA (adenosine(37)-N6)-threonylcarbamoyltransferase complex transferase subunit TsaD [Nitrospirillum amazonense]|uniref:tRNA N6-adenosine threonylcarbamoyltransferase n=1 Tax=Nitrospirillum amazonense TaxID=28077 RepID=A0A560JVC9_9PROT|nr:tRNA (adenosine(37)-N6)-threonylcarbamoyltransferase complex transferase subunit TsaD [Nitrospirillum amazonense]MDG3440709.1 tRNA (adenosine(37)-N6)-threonylcarbamoyltransferase complex transferase subunit TsaD [Nitrospirillum amazonense]TWB74956.1 O-sialoglycoprotein endopeptidase [Nitrospirillum amazonense]